MKSSFFPKKIKQVSNEYFHPSRLLQHYSQVCRQKNQQKFPEIGSSRVFLTEWINPGIMAHTTECHELIQTVSFGDPKLHSEISYLLKQLLFMYTQNSYGIGLYCVLWGPLDHM